MGVGCIPNPRIRRTKDYQRCVSQRRCKTVKRRKAVKARPRLTTRLTSPVGNEERLRCLNKIPTLCVVGILFKRPWVAKPDPGCFGLCLVLSWVAIVAHRIGHRSAKTMAITRK